MPEKGFRSGFVALVGLPNAGKSTLLNRLLGGKLSIVSSKPQTTRHKILGIVNGRGFQAVFIDTPGWLDPHYTLQKSMLLQSKMAIGEDADVACLIVEPVLPPPPEIDTLIAALERTKVPKLLAINKTDAAAKGEPAAAEEAYKKRLPFVSTHKISALSGSNVVHLLDAVAALLPEQEAFYPEGQATDRWERFFATEAIREAIFETYQDEIPYACAVELEQFVEEAGRPDKILATIYVERDSQKGIIIGKKGFVLRDLTEKARKAIAKLTGRQTELDIWVKVQANWRNDPKALRRFGY